MKATSNKIYTNIGKIMEQRIYIGISKWNSNIRGRDGNNICGLSKRNVVEGRKEENDGGLEGLAHLSGSEGRVNTVVRVVGCSKRTPWLIPDWTQVSALPPILFLSRGIHSRWLPKNTSRETNTATAILRRRTNSWTDHAQKQRVQFYESWIGFCFATALFTNNKENGKDFHWFGCARISSLIPYRLFLLIHKSSCLIYCFFFSRLLKIYKYALIKINIKLISDIMSSYFYNDSLYIILSSFLIEENKFIDEVKELVH